MRMVHHKSGSGEFCPRCGREFIFEWYDQEEKNGKMETKWTTDEICLDCVKKQNNGLPPLGLKEIEEIRKRGITKEQYYKEKGY